MMADSMKVGQILLLVGYPDGHKINIRAMKLELVGRIYPQHQHRPEFTILCQTKYMKNTGEQTVLHILEVKESDHEYPSE